MRTDRPEPARRSPTLIVSLLGVVACGVAGGVIAVSAFDSSSAADAVLPWADAGVIEVPDPASDAPWTVSTQRPAAPLPHESAVVVPAPIPPEVRVSEGELQRGGTLARSLSRHGVTPEVIDQIARGMAGYFDFRRSQPGHFYQLTQNADGSIEAFLYRTSPIAGYQMLRETDGSLPVSRFEAMLAPRRVMIAGIVTSSLFGAITDLGGGAQLVHDFTNVFAYDLDFYRMIQRGDEFRIVYEQLYREDASGEEVFVRPGRILAARFAGAAGELTAVYYELEEGRGGYYRTDGSSVERQFLLTPLQHSRITSHYSSSRRHPILNVIRPHHGIDYAAPIGAAVFAVADGEVIHRSPAGGFGNLVKVRHENGYVSYYGHLSRFATDLRVGQSVSQKQVIGYVGSTGLSTGPHVCFRIAKDGRYVNPAKVWSPEGPPLPVEAKEGFQAQRDALLAALDSGTLVASDEAL